MQRITPFEEYFLLRGIPVVKAKVMPRAMIEEALAGSALINSRSLEQGFRVNRGFGEPSVSHCLSIIEKISSKLKVVLTDDE